MSRPNTGPHFRRIQILCGSFTIFNFILQGDKTLLAESANKKALSVTPQLLLPDQSVLEYPPKIAPKVVSMIVRVQPLLSHFE
jgi:hypothetical protein